MKGIGEPLDEVQGLSLNGQRTIRYAVAVTLIKEGIGKHNILTHLYDISAVSSDEATGTAYRLSREDHPEHTVFNIAYKDFS